ncbi:unnamed protein product, partial [marine sediment metagenome]
VGRFGPEMELLARPVRPVQGVILGRQDYEGPPVLWDLQDPLVYKVTRVSKENRGSRETLVIPAPRVPQAHKVRKVILVNRVPRVSLEQPGQLELMDHLEHSHTLSRWELVRLLGI